LENGKTNHENTKIGKHEDVIIDDRMELRTVASTLKA
jgi:hypothetical protein